MGAAPLEVLRVAARMAADLPGQSRRHVLETAAESVGLSLDRRFLAADLDRLEWELRQYQGTFRPEQRRQLRELREAALQAMEFFAEFRPRLVGDVLFGTADDRSPIALQLFADTPEQVIERLLEREIPSRNRSGPGTTETGTANGSRYSPLVPESTWSFWRCFPLNASGRRRWCREGEGPSFGGCPVAGLKRCWPTRRVEVGAREPSSLRRLACLAGAEPVHGVDQHLDLVGVHVLVDAVS